MGMAERAERRWHARRAGQPVGEVAVQESAQIALPLPAATVWAFIESPDSTPLVVDGFVQSFSVPDTPVGEVGEVRCSVVRHEGDTLIGIFSECAELDPGRRAVWRSLSTKEAVITITEVVPASESACVLRLTSGISVKAGAEDPTRRLIRKRLDEAVKRTRDVLTAMHPGT